MTEVEKIEEIAQPIALRHDCDVVQITFRREQPGWVLRLLLERRGSDPRTGSGVDHKLCAAVSRDLGAAIDVEGAFTEAFVLEVSSPGIERPLVRPADYARFAGRPARFETKAPIAGRKRFRGAIGAASGEGVEVALEDGGRVTLPYAQITKANLVFEGSGMISRAGEK